jgi:ATP synthase protein I
MVSSPRDNPPKGATDPHSEQAPHKPLNGHHLGPEGEDPLADLQRRIAAQQATRAAAEEKADTGGRLAKGMGTGGRMAADFVSAILVGAAVGWGFDQWLGTSPWGVISCFLLGFCAGILGVIRLAQRAQTGQRDAQPEQVGPGGA